MKPILNIENLTKIYGNVPSQTKALNGITFQVMPESFSALWEAAVPVNPHCSIVLRL